jgi:hypothetical protein
MFSNFIPSRQTGIQYRSDEGSYGLMLAAASPQLDSLDSSGNPIAFGQLWVAGGKGMRKQGQYPNKPTRLFVQVQNGKVISNLVSAAGGLSVYASGLGTVGYSITPSTNVTKPGYRYGDSMGTLFINNNGYMGSDIMYQYKYQP